MGDCQETCSGQRCWLQRFMQLLTKIWSSSRSWPDGCPIDGWRDEEGASQDRQHIRSNNCRGSMTILDNVLTVSDSVEVKSELVGPPSPRRVPRRSRRGVWEISRQRTSPRGSGSGKSATKSVWRSLAAMFWKLKVLNALSIIFFYIEVVWVQTNDTQYMFSPSQWRTSIAGHR